MMREIIWDEHSRIALRFYYIDFIDFTKLSSFEEHSHKDFIEIMYLFQGTVEQSINYQNYKNSQGDLIVLRNSDHHKLIQGEGRCVVLRIKNIFLHKFELLIEKPALFERLNQSPQLLTTKLSADNREAFEELFDKIIGAEDHVMASFFLVELFTRLFRDYLYHCLQEKPIVDKVPWWFNSLLIDIKKRHIPDLQVSDLNKLCGYSREHIARIFKKSLNVSPSTYLNELKLEHAANMLINTDEKLLSVCYESGFDNLAYFHRLFKKKFNTTPNQYRNNNKA